MLFYKDKSSTIHKKKIQKQSGGGREKFLMVNNSVASAMDLSVSQHLSHTFTMSIVNCKISPIFNDNTNFQNGGLILDCSLQIQTLTSHSTNYLFSPDY